MADQPTAHGESSPVGEPDRDRRLGEVLAAYFAAVEAGTSPTPEELIARHPELARELEGFFADQERFGRLVAPLRPVAQAAQAQLPTLAGVEPTEPPSQSQGPAPAASLSMDEARGAVPDRDAATVDQPEGPGPADDADGDADAGPDLPRGTRVRYLGDYELHRVLGRGGMGVVYKAKQRSLNRLVAVKMIRAGLWADEGEVRRFRNEAEAVANLDHPQIVTIHEVGEHDGHHYFSMRLVDGPSLAERLAETATDPRRAARLVAEVARAVHHAHMRGILHRDLKPANILLDGEGRPHVTDFGLARRIDGEGGQSVSGSIVGTPQYMAPEQAVGSRRGITTATDVYGLGAVLYACLTGRAPFEADSVIAVLDQVRHRPPQRPGALNTRVGRDLETVCLRCLEKDPRRRYASADAVAVDLGRYLAAEPILARRTGPFERSVLWMRRRPAMAAMLAVVASTAAFGVGGIAWQWRRAERARDALAETNAVLNRRLYYHLIALAEAAWRANNVDRVRQLLEQCPPPLRGWEWQYLNRLQHRGEASPLLGHSDIVQDVAFSPDGRLIASGGHDKVLILWDAATGRERHRFEGHSRVIQSVAFSPDSCRLASASDDQTVKVWDVATGTKLFDLRGHAQCVYCVAYSPDGKYLASGGWDKKVRLWDAVTGRQVRVLEHASLSAGVAFSPDSRRLASTGSNGALRVWDVVTGRILLDRDEHDDWTYGVAFSPDGTQLATSSLDGSAKLWDAATGEVLFTLEGHTNDILKLAFSPDGRRLATASLDGTVKLWDPVTGQEALTLRGHTAAVCGVAFSPDGRLVSSSFDRTLRIWDATPVGRAINPAPPLIFRGHDAVVTGLSFSHDGAQLASVDLDGVARIWDVASGRKPLTIEELSQEKNHIAFSPDGTRIATAGRDGAVLILDAATGQSLATLHGHTAPPPLGVAFSPDGTRLASGGEDRSVILWDAATSQLIHRFEGHTGPIINVEFSPDGTSIASAGKDQSIILWEVATGRKVRRLGGHDGYVYFAVFSPDGRRLASASADGTAKVWNTATGREELVLIGHSSVVFGVAYSPDGRHLATAGYDRSVRVWDAATGRLVVTLRGHTHRVRCVAFSPDGRRLASAGKDATVRIWDLAPWLGPPARP